MSYISNLLIRSLIFSFMLGMASSTSWALQPGPDDVFVRVIDTGAGLCSVVVFPGEPGGGPKYVIYDAGHWKTAAQENTMKKLAEVIPAGHTVDYLVLSHSDGDHIGAVNRICEKYKIQTIMHTGLAQDSASWRDAYGAIAYERIHGGATDINLEQQPLAPGSTYKVGRGWLTILGGVFKTPESWNLSPSSSEWRNANSIVIRLAYAGGSVLFAGDAVGKSEAAGQEASIATEKRLLEFNEALPIKSSVIIAPHHGGNDASSSEFIRAVAPEWVVFSAGHEYEHPRAVTAQRYVDAGVPINQILRTDRGDNEGGQEWSVGGGASKDPIGDDDVDILLKKDGTVIVEYRIP